MPLAIHIGVRMTEVDTFIKQFERETLGGAPVTDINERWTVIPDEDEAVSHLVIETMNQMITLNMLVGLFAVYLVPNYSPELDGVRIVVTDTDDYTSEYVELRFPD